MAPRGRRSLATARVSGAVLGGLFAAARKLVTAIGLRHHQECGADHGGAAKHLDRTDHGGAAKHLERTSEPSPHLAQLRAHVRHDPSDRRCLALVAFTARGETLEPVTGLHR